MGYSTILPLAVVGALIYVIVIKVRHASKEKSFGCQPAPLFRPWDVLGIQNFRIEMNGMRTYRLSDAFLMRKKEMSAKLGRDVKTFRIYYPPGETWYYTFDPRNLQAVLATQFQDFQQPWARVGAFEPLLGLGIFSANGPTWEHSRALLRPQFIREQIADLGLFEAHVQNLFNAIPAGEWTPCFNMQPLLERLTMDIATEFLFGESVLGLRDGGLVSKKEMMQFVEAFAIASRTTAKSMIFGDLFWLMHDRKFREQCKVVHDFVDTYVERRLREEKRTDRYVVLDALVAEIKDPKELRTQLLHILLAGSDTISGTLGFTLAALAQHPHVFQKLRKVVLDDFGTEITLTGLRNCTYLQWCLNEVLRVYPAVPVNFREAVRDTTLPVGGGDGSAPVFVPKGHLVAWEVWTMHSDPENWGPDADEFKPERWEGKKYGFHYLPFNAGPRVCLGQQFALTEVGYVIVRLLQRFDAIDGSALPKGRLPCDWKLVDKVAGGVRMRLHRAEK